ncbi:MAG: calcineurin-like phosphoesterase family protein, partial [Maribacter sp.]
MNRLHYYLIIIIFIASSCSTSKIPYLSKDNKTWEQTPLPQGKLSKTIFLVGDMGKEYDEGELNPVLGILKKDIELVDNSSLVFLGDNIYPKGMPANNHPDRDNAEQIIKSQLDILADYKGETYFIPGNHDWNNSKRHGLEQVRDQEKFIESYYSDRENIFHFPDHGCGEPVKVKEDNKLIYIFIDSQWWLQNWEHERGMNEGCEVKSRQAFLDEFHQIITKHKNKQIVIFMHHPLFSNGSHGGFFSA